MSGALADARRRPCTGLLDVRSTAARRAGGTLAGMEMSLEEVAEGVFVCVQPDGGWCLNNAGIVTAGGECALVDTAATEARALRLRELAATVCAEPPRTVVNTHFHGDHTFGNAFFPEAVVVAHRGTRTEMAAAGLHLTGLWPDVHWGKLSVRLPAVTFREHLTLYAGDIRMELLRLGPAHSPNDTVVWLPDQRVLFAGDLAMSGVTPFVLMGSVAGSIGALERLRSLGARTVVPGHGPVCGPEVLDENLDYLRWVARSARSGVASGLTPGELARRTGAGRFSSWLDSERLLPNLRRGYAEERGGPLGESLDISALFAEMVAFHGRLPTCHA